MVAEDDVDTESLQAQIDMSMSIAHDLVTSWIKPTHLAQLRSSGVNASQIIEEQLRRPPRLGVGTSIPTEPLAREASKLKRRLGKNGAENGGIVESQLQESSKSDDEEPKGRPAKRKTKADPFEGSKKKTKAESDADPYPVENVSKNSVSLLKNSTLEKLLKHNPSSRKDERRMGPGDQSSHVTEGERSATWISSPPSRETSVPVPGKPTTPASSRAHAFFTPIPDRAKPLGVPLLNLDGPPELTDKPGNTNESNNSRKKRKRRKKKKNQVMPVRETSHIEQH